ncbi:MAG: hypothetical protein RL490_2136 [Pseudomonadota bacterium]|jgi:TPR repeat protein
MATLLRRLAPAVAVFLLLLTAPAPAAERRLALIIANEAYVAPGLGRLPGTQTDALRMKRALTAAGFQVKVLRDLKLVELRRAIAGFSRDLSAAGRDGVGFFYFTGHGIANAARGQNYLIPVDAEISALSDLAFYAQPLDEMLDSVEGAGAKAAFIVIDACRNTPVSLGRGGKGLAPSNAKTDTLIAYATSPGTTAADDGLYSRLLADEIGRAGATSDTVFSNVQIAVARASQRSQIPQFVSGLTDTISFGSSPPQTNAGQRPVVNTAVTKPPTVQKPQADAGDAATLRKLAVQYYNAKDNVIAAKAEAFRLFKRLAALGDPEAQLQLGKMYLEADGTPYDPGEALQQFSLAAAQGQLQAQLNLGTVHYFGKAGLAVNKTEAARYFRLAADGGLARAQANLAGMYFTGEGGLGIDKIAAEKWYRRAAEQGNAAGQSGLAVLLENGDSGLAVDKAEAVRFYRLAAAQGDAFSKTALKRLGVSE